MPMIKYLLSLPIRIVPAKFQNGWTNSSWVTKPSKDKLIDEEHGKSISAFLLKDYSVYSTSGKGQHWLR